MVKLAFWVLSSLLAAVVDSGGILLIQLSTFPLPEALSDILWLVIGDMAGLMIVLVGLMFLL